MKLKVVVLDLALSRTEKYVGALAFTLAGVLATSVALADVVPFTAGETLTAGKLNANFDDLDDRVTTQAAEAADLDSRVTDAEMSIATLEEVPSYLVSTSNVAQTGAANTDFVYNTMEVTLQPGTWLVESNAVLLTAGASDLVQLGLWNQTTSSDVPNSRGAAAQSAALNGGTVCGTMQYCLAAPGSASAVITVTVPTTIRAKAFRNGGSTLTVGPPPGVGIVLAPLNRISALRLR